MQGIHLFDRHAKTVIDLESFVEQDHLLRKIDRVLDTAFVRELTAACYADGLGRTSIDPEVYFRIELVAYLYGISSERQLCKDVYYNLAYRWFCVVLLTLGLGGFHRADVIPLPVMPASLWHLAPGDRMLPGSASAAVAFQRRAKVPFRLLVRRSATSD